jgi:hypothetical protein
MKKGFVISILTLTLLLLVTTYVCAETESAILFGYDWRDQLSSSSAGDKTTNDVDPGMTFTYEFTVGESGLKNGFGFQYQMEKAGSEEDGDELNFQFLPVYGLIALEVAETEITDTYLVGKLGYNFFKITDLEEGCNAKNGLYYAVGLAMKIGPNFTTQVLYEEYNGEITSDIAALDIVNKVYSFKCGFTF